MPDAACTTTQPRQTGTVLAFDFGTRRIGVAIGERLLGEARPLMTIHGEANHLRFSAISQLIEEWQPTHLVVGFALATDGSEHAMSARCRRFAHQLEGRFKLPVTLQDERYSSTAAESQLSATGLNWQTRKQQVDALAAQLILQDYFDAQ